MRNAAGARAGRSRSPKNPSWAVREGAWKLLGNPQDTSVKAPIAKEDQLFLVNPAEDVGETKNVAREHPEVVKRLQKLHEEWVEEVQEQ